MPESGRSTTIPTENTGTGHPIDNYKKIHAHTRRYFFLKRTLAFDRYNFISQKERKKETLEKFHANLVELAPRTDCGDREDERVCDMFTAEMSKEKIAEELLTETRSPQEAYEFAVEREKGIQRSKTVKKNLLGAVSTTTATVK